MQKFDDGNRMLQCFLCDEGERECKKWSVCMYMRGQFNKLRLNTSWKRVQRGAKNLLRNLGGKKREKGRKEQNYKLSEIKMTRGKLKKKTFFLQHFTISVLCCCVLRELRT